ncbi:MAG: helix-turn-helix domain-containing protein [Treponema sp.]|nr:helix-turn-helix domain-containing protein [Treponema sp.]
MSILREISGLGSRPYPIDHERRRRVLVALAERDLNITSLARTLNITRSYVSEIISGRDKSKKIQQRIAKILCKPTYYLFPPRTPEEIGKMRHAEKARNGKAA